MVFTNRTSEFKEICFSQPEAKRRKTDKGKSTDDDQRTSDERRFAKAYLEEAYAILKHVATLLAFLTSIRRPYLNVDSNPGYQRQSRTFDLANSAVPGESLSALRYLSNEERDQIDLQARVILSKCAGRVKEMEILEKRRQEANLLKVNPLLRLLPTRLMMSDGPANEEFVAAHYSNIAWYLTRRLADASQIQKEMQEERIRRQMEKAKTLGSSAISYDIKSSQVTTHSNQPERSFSAFTSSFMRREQPDQSLMVAQELESDEESEDDLELSPAQIQQFEEENAAILRQVENTLQAVQQAESRLLEISSLQTELVVQLAKQTETVEQLYDEAITTQGEVEKGHVQLRQARERAKSSRKWILIFILGATMAMLFLHWYD